jgi:hypothetical protein
MYIVLASFGRWGFNGEGLHQVNEQVSFCGERFPLPRKGVNQGHTPVDLRFSALQTK